MSDEITTDEKIAFLKHLFPEKMYTVAELAKMFKRTKRTIEYWMAIYEIPSLKVTGSPMILQESLIEWLLRTESNEEKNCGLEFILADMKKRLQKVTKR